MSEKEFVNPFDPANFTHGGGLWDGKTVTITAVKAQRAPMTHKDGSPVLDENGQPIVRNVLRVTGIADDAEAERFEEWSAGGLIPTDDGEGFVSPKDGSVTPLHGSSEAGKAIELARQGGFDTSLLVDMVAKKPKLSGLVGAKFVMKAEARLDKNGKEKKNAKGYVQQRFYPVKFVGFADGYKPVSPEQNNALDAKATTAITTILAENGGKVSRAALVRLLSAKLAGDTDGNKIIGLVTKESFHTNKPWTRDETSYSLPV